MTELIVVHGPPGTGKTTRLTRLFEQSVKRYGPDRVAAITYTRAAAQELKDRAAAILGLQGDYRSLTRQLPYVGTIHALCYRALLKPRVMTTKLLKEFTLNQMGFNLASEDLPDPEEVEGFWYASSYEQDHASNQLAFLRMLAIARHRLRPELLEMMLPGLGFSVDLTSLAEKYTAWKKQQHVVDFEDLLELGQHTSLPVDVLIVDEAQDNSPLMWKVVLHWAAKTKFVVVAGDPFQAIYAWAGADPSLLMRLGAHAQRFHTLKQSWRLDPKAASNADLILREGGWSDDKWMGTWEGTEHTQSSTDQSVFWLARTRRLLHSVRDLLLEEGTPFLELRGLSAWSSKAGNAYRILSRLIEGDILELEQLKLLADLHTAAELPSGLHAELLRLKGNVTLVSRSGAERVLRAPLELARAGLPNASYFDKMVEQHGRDALYLQPKVKVGTIHAAKGKEADVVHLVTSWGYLPARALAEAQGQKEEACVAYVGSTRHRHELILESPPHAGGRSYPWPN